MKRFIKNNSLSIVLCFLFLFSFAGQIAFGLKEYNQDLAEKGAMQVNLLSYFSSGHFLESTFENWESEFLQMALFVVLTIFLKQKGSSESKKFDEPEPVDRKPNSRKKNAPWPVKKGGWILALYKHSLTIALTFMFVVSFILHFYGSLKDENHNRELKNQPPYSTMEYIGESRFWFESFQNWQSEFLSIFSVVIFSIYLRQQGSPQSKPVDAPTMETED